MKLTIIHVICVLLIVGGLGLYVYGIAVKGDSPTENLGRVGIAVLSGVSALIRLRSATANTRRPSGPQGVRCS